MSPPPQLPQPAAVPLIDLQTQWSTIRAEVLEAIERLADTQRFVLGPEVAALEEEIAAYLGCAHAVGVSSGTDALLVSLMAIDVQAEDEVITTPYSFFSTAGSIARLGARPVFVDIDPATFNLDPARLESAITSRTRAVVPVHLYGQAAEMNPIREIARRHQLRVIEDAAQAIGTRYHDQPVGSLGDLGCFSFYPTKNLGALGDGGLVTTGDEQLAARIRQLRNHGFSPKYHAQSLGGNFRLDAIQAAALRVKLKYLDEWNDARIRNAAAYERLFKEAGLASNDGAQGKVVLPARIPGGRHIYHQYVIRVAAEARGDLREWLTDRAIGSEVYYPVPLHLQACFADLGHRPGDFPLSEAAAAETIALPIYPELTETLQRRVVKAIGEFFADRGP